MTRIYRDALCPVGFHTQILLAVRAYAGCASGSSCLLAGVAIVSVIGGA